MQTNRPKTKLLVDGGDPDETLRVKKLIRFVDGQTTNPSLIAKNPEINSSLRPAIWQPSNHLGRHTGGDKYDRYCGWLAFHGSDLGRVSRIGAFSGEC